MRCMGDASKYSFGLLLTKSARMVQKRYDERLQKHGLESGVLALIAVHDGIAPAEIALQMHSDRATVSAMIRRLQQLSLVVLRKSETDGRSRCLSLTAAGCKLMSEIQAIDAEVSKGISRGLSSAERKTVREQEDRFRNPEAAGGSGRLRSEERREGRLRAPGRAQRGRAFVLQ